MADVELMALYWTIAGPADVHTGREWSTFDWRDRCEQAAKVGYKGIGLWHADIEHQLETRTLREMKQIFDDAGLKYLQLEFIADFWVPEGDPLRAASDERRKLLFDAAARVRRLPHQGGQHPGHARPRSRSSPRPSASCARTPWPVPAAWTSSTSSCRST